MTRNESDQSIALAGVQVRYFSRYSTACTQVPRAWLVRCNLVIGGSLALTPAFLFVVILLAASPLSRTLGDWINLPAAIAALLLSGIGEAPFMVIIPFLFALIFLRRLLQSQEIPPNVKKRTAFL